MLSHGLLYCLIINGAKIAMLKKVVKKTTLLKNVLKGNTLSSSLAFSYASESSSSVGHPNSEPDIGRLSPSLGALKGFTTAHPHGFREGDFASSQILLERGHNILLVIPWSFAEVRLAL